jgi:hypothetical protein
MLLKLEHESVGVKIAARKQALQADLKSKRDTVKRIQGRLQALDERFKEESSSEEDEADSEVISESRPTEEAQQSTLSQNLRSRKPGSNQPIDTAYTTGTHHSPYQSTKSRFQPKDRSNLTRDELLDESRVTHEHILDQMLGLTSELKSSAALFNTTLKGDEKHVDQAFKGMEKNTDGMESASLRMTTLRKMTEGKGWFGRMMLYAYIGALWVLALVIVFVLPKLRF